MAAPSPRGCSPAEPSRLRWSAQLVFAKVHDGPERMMREGAGSMKVPMTVGDFLDRAVTVFPDREALVDEPGTPGALGRITYRELGARARGMAIALDRMGV